MQKYFFPGIMDGAFRERMFPENSRNKIYKTLIDWFLLLEMHFYFSLSIRKRLFHAICTFFLDRETTK
jgi:hypothetical protein